MPRRVSAWRPRRILKTMRKQGVSFGFKLASEEFSANELVRLAGEAEQRGFDFALISDHYHPWSDEEGESPFVWSVLGAIAHATSTLIVGTGVTCPSMRIHPAIIAQAAATTATMMPGRFFLGVGAGENLNEHILGHHWPEVEVRHERLAEAIEVIRLLWEGGLQSHHGKHFVIENARIYSLPDEPPPLLVAAAGPKGASLASKFGDGMIGTEPDRQMIRQFRKEGGKGPLYCEVQACFDDDEEIAIDFVHDYWPIAALPGPVFPELPLPSHFEKAGAVVARGKISEGVACGPDPQKHLQMVRKYIDAGYDHICVHQIGPKQTETMDFYMQEIIPQLTKARRAA